MMRIGIDFDDTLMNTRRSMVELLNTIHKKQIVFEEIQVYEVSDLYEYDFKQFYNFFSTNQYNLNSIKPEGRVIEVIKKLSDKGKLALITARPIEWMDSAIEWIKKYNIAINDYHCASEYLEGKTECAKKLEVTIFVEDHPRHALELARNGINVFLINKPYNQECVHENIRRVNDWDEIEQIILNS